MLGINGLDGFYILLELTFLDRSFSCGTCEKLVLTSLGTSVWLVLWLENQRQDSYFWFVCICREWDHPVSAVNEMHFISQGWKADVTMHGFTWKLMFYNSDSNLCFCVWKGRVLLGFRIWMKYTEKIKIRSKCKEISMKQLRTQ